MFGPHMTYHYYMNEEMKMTSQVEIDKLEWEVKRQQDIALDLANLLNEKIDECEELKSEIDRLNNLILAMEIK